MAKNWHVAVTLCPTTLVLGLSLPLRTLAEPPRAQGIAPLKAAFLSVEPWSPTDSSAGLGELIFARTAALAGHPMKASHLPLPRLLNELQAGAISFAALAGTDERDAIADRVCEIGMLRFSLAVPRRSSRADGLLEMAGKSYAMIRGVDPHALPQLQGMQPYPVTTMKQGLSMLSMGRVDAAVCARPGCMSALRKAGIEADSLDYLPLLSLPLVIYATKARASEPAFEAAKASLRKRCTEKDAQAAFAGLLARFD